MTEILSQEEVDALLNAIQKGEVPADDAAPVAESVKRKVEPYDFHKPHLISNEQLRGLQIIHDTFAKNLQSSLSGLLRTGLEVKLVAIDQLLYSEFVLSLYNPTFLTVLNAPPLIGNLLVEMNLAIIMVVIDRLLGGVGVGVPAPRELTTIEMAIVRSVVNAVLEELRVSWAGTMEAIKFEVESHDFTPEFLRIAPPEASVLSVTLDMRFGEAAGVMNLCYPFSVIKPCLPKLSSESLVARNLKESSPVEKKRMMRNLGIIPLGMHAVIGRAILNANQIARLQVGDILCMDNRADEPIDLVIEGRGCFKAEVGQRHGKTAVRLLAPIKQEESEG